MVWLAKPVDLVGGDVQGGEQGHEPLPTSSAVRRATSPGCLGSTTAVRCGPGPGSRGSRPSPPTRTCCASTSPSAATPPLGNPGVRPPAAGNITTRTRCANPAQTDDERTLDSNPPITRSQPRNQSRAPLSEPTPGNWLSTRCAFTCTPLSAHPWIEASRVFGTVLPRNVSNSASFASTLGAAGRGGCG